MDAVYIYIGLALAFGLFMAWGIGANDVANAMATSIGSGALTVRQALLVAAVFEFTGAVLAGGEVTKTIRKGMVDSEVLVGQPELLIFGMLAALLAAGLWLLIASRNGWPVSTTHSIVGAIVGFEQSSPENRIFVITGRNTFSAAQNFINRVERLTNATFVGEPSSSSPNFVGEETDLLLPWSRLRGSISTRYWQDSDPWDERPWIAPDLAVELTVEQYLEGVDPVLERVLQEIE